MSLHPLGGAEHKTTFLIHASSVYTICICVLFLSFLDIDLKHQGNDTSSLPDDPMHPEVDTATGACICNVDGKFNGTLTPERLNLLRRAFEKTKCIS